MLFGVVYVDQHPRWATFKKIDTEYGNAIKAAGGSVDWINLPDIGIKGNGHMMMQGFKNNLQVGGHRGWPPSGVAAARFFHAGSCSQTRVVPH